MRLRHKKISQVSIELMIIFSLVLFVFLVFLAFVTSSISDIQENEDYIAMERFANDVKNEVILATQVHDNYIRRFDIPVTINGKEYNAYLNGNVLTIYLMQGGRKITKNHVEILPVEVKGGFIEYSKINMTDHCVTKNQYDGIRIARNQVSLEPYYLNGVPIESDQEYVPIKKGTLFYVYARMNCVENIKGFQFTLRFNGSNVEYINHSLLDRNHDFNNVLFNKIRPRFFPLGLSYDFNKGIDYFDEENSYKENLANCFTRPSDYNEFPYPLYDIEGNLVGNCSGVDLSRITIGITGLDCVTGSGNIVRIKFKAVETGTTKIEFDPEFNKEEYIKRNQTFKNNIHDNLLVFKCNNPTPNPEAIPDSKVNAKLNITA